MFAARPASDGPGSVPTRRPRRSPGVVAALVFLAAAIVLLVEARYSPFEIDESGYVATSRYFGYLVFQRDVTREEWGTNYWTLTQPPLTRYVIGAWLTVYGYDLEKLNKPYVSTASSYEVNVMKGRVPTDDVLWRSRQPLALLGAGSVALLYLLGARLAGWTVGLVTAVLTLSSSFIRYTLVHVWAEGPLAFFFVLAALLAVCAAPRLVSGHRWRRWTIGLAAALAVAASIKMTAVVGVVALGVWAAVVSIRQLQPWRRDRRARPEGPSPDPKPLALRLSAMLMTVAAVVAGVWVLVNPFLWRGPLDGTWAMVVNRANEMAEQQQQWPEYAVLGWSERPWLALSGSLQIGPLAETSFAVLTGLPLLVVGVGALASRFRQPGQSARIGMLAAWTATYFVAIVLGLGLKYPRYFMPTTLLFLPVVALGAVSIAQSVWRRLPRSVGRPQPVT